jgi:hypothetical protein
MIRAGTITALYLFDVAEHIDLIRLRQLIGTGSEARLTSKATTATAYLRYQTPPLVADGETLGFSAIDGFRPRLKFFDYGVISLALTRSFSGSWAELVDSSSRYIENGSLEAHSEAAVRRVVERCQDAITRPRRAFLSEDYLVVALNGVDGATAAEELLAVHGHHIAQLLRGETQPLSAQEQEEVLRVRLSYLATDLVIPTWNAAFVYDSEANAAATLELLEFANSQLLEFRYHDALLDAELAGIYPQLQRTSWWNNLMGRGTARAATQLHSLFIDINEITDRTENALKIVGDIYAARLLALVSARLGIARWRASVDDKLETLDDIYRFAVEQIAFSRGQFLELTVVLILLLELVLFFVGIMK